MRILQKTVIFVMILFITGCGINTGSYSFEINKDGSTNLSITIENGYTIEKEGNRILVSDSETNTMFEAVAISAKDVSVYEEIAITNDSYKTGSIDNVSFIYWSYENSGRVEHNYVVNLIDSESSFLVTSDVDSELIQPLFSLLELIEK